MVKPFPSSTLWYGSFPGLPPRLRGGGPAPPGAIGLPANFGPLQKVPVSVTVAEALHRKEGARRPPLVHPAPPPGQASGMFSMSISPFRRAYHFIRVASFVWETRAA